MKVRPDSRLNVQDGHDDVGEASGCFCARSLCDGIDAHASGIASAGAESVFESLAGECEGGTMGTMAYVLYRGAGRLCVLLRDSGVG